MRGLNQNRTFCGTAKAVPFHDAPVVGWFEILSAGSLAPLVRARGLRDDRWLGYGRVNDPPKRSLDGAPSRVDLEN